MNLPNLETQKELVGVLKELDKTITYSNNESYVRNVLLRRGADRVVNLGVTNINSQSPKDLINVTGKGRLILFVPRMPNGTNVLKLEVILDGVSIEVYNKATTYGTGNEVWAFDERLVYREGGKLIVNHINYSIAVSTSVERETIISDGTFNNSLIVRATVNLDNINIDPTIIYSFIEEGE